jgi:phospholipid/cholesterol/gamma-HCH transport system ATP-binding protein
MSTKKPDISQPISPKPVKNEPVIEISHLHKSFGEQEVLSDVSLKLYKGENLAVLGKSGNGKSVLVKCISGLLGYDSGTITLFNKDLAKMTRKELGDVRTKIGFLFQGGALYDSMTVKQNLEFPLQRIRRELSREQVNKKVVEVLEQVGLADALNKMPSQLSGGMRKRISLARTIIVDPLIMLYDEPTTGLDPATSAEISTLINEVQRRYKTSSIIITHDIQCANETADRIVMLNGGKIYKEGSVEDFQNSPDPLIRSFFLNSQ